jgi:hypothetical protein
MIKFLCPRCISPEIEEPAGTSETQCICENCGARFGPDSRLISVSEARAFAAELGACTCDRTRGCPQCFQRADELVGSLIRDAIGAEWVVEDVDEKDVIPTIGGAGHWAWVHEATVLRPAS